MAALHSKISTSFRYDLRGSTCLVTPGRNEVSAETLVKLRGNSAFRKHVEGGHVEVLVPVGVNVTMDLQPTVAPVPPVPPEPAHTPDPSDVVDAPEDGVTLVAPPPVPPVSRVDPRDRLPGESNNTYRRRLTALDELFKKWDAFDETTREALWPSLKPEEQAAIQARSK